ncbi:MAG: MotA/TolQ/ExbB proton channel family protein [Rhodospirillales bacterium]|nr:MotA/TolQ/ExbB proton channel family protein [Rhodospirillales bacterium]MDE2576062.1 MotA/TolQ/ExbB proton channel family protein [Rhodospirillales bacterium]
MSAASGTAVAGAALTVAPPRPVPGALVVSAISIGLALLIIAVLSVVLPFNSKPAQFLLDHGSGSIFAGVYPLTIQNVLHLLSAAALGILYRRWRRAGLEEAYLRAGFLPSDEHTLLGLDELGPLRRMIHPHLASRAAVPVLMDAAILQASTSRSLEQVSTVMDHKLELMSHRLDLEYQIIRYIAWLVPTMGFVGTVVGIAAALEGINDPAHLHMERITAGLGVAFYTTILALVESAVLVFIQNVVQRREELALNAAADYCLTNLINRIYIPH